MILIRRTGAGSPTSAFTQNSDGVFVSQTQKLHALDTGNAHENHDFIVDNSIYVWQPSFRAYMLINPTACSHPSRPIGFFVSVEPATGIVNADYVEVLFLGFYAGKYQASRNDASNSAAGVGTLATSRQGVIPWISVDWDASVAACIASNVQMMTNEQAVSLAVYSMLIGPAVFGANRWQPYGNNSSLKDVDDTSVVFTADPTQAGRALIGTGTKTGWGAGVNLTTHNGKTTGVYDLNGNVWEWVAGITLRNSEITKGGVPSGVIVSGTSGQKITALKTLAAITKEGIQASMDVTGVAEFGHDGFWFATVANTEYFPLRGGSWGSSSSAGVFALLLYYVRSNVLTNIGFRAAFVVL
ncbi:MAG: hypothetical protein COA82_06565 [Alkaliphilus sp.]|nr:hypothetical protein [Alkaliphilus sp. AH-315-G20]MBN4067640.1 hypothetical protein [Alkaliphilus transvaalensis]MBN4074830.1 hypothetical protein [bacterium AH-315-E09]PHS34887.1 MAG: hypothetical protein COA82_06565 [Alkaliphilus sp.]